MMNTRTILNVAEITHEEDLREIFNVDAQFINRDNEYYESNGPDGVIPFQSVVREHNWTQDLDKVVRLLGEKLMEFDSDFVYFDYNVIDINGRQVVSVVFNVLEY